VPKKLVSKVYLRQLKRKNSLPPRLHGKSRFSGARQSARPTGCALWRGACLYRLWQRLDSDRCGKRGQATSAQTLLASALG